MNRTLWILPLCAALGGCHRAEPAAAVAPPAGEVWVTAQQAEEIRLATVPAADREVGAVIVTSGKIAYDELRVSHVFSPVTGRVMGIQAELGQRVHKGQSLATIDSPDLGVASADVAKAQADVIASEHDFARQRELSSIRAVARKDFEAAEDNVRKARAELERARQKARLLAAPGGGAVGQGFVLRSLIDGEVMSRTINPGAEVAGQYGGGNPAVELFTIGDTDVVWVMADVFEMDLSRVQVGQRVAARVVAYPDKVFEGTVDWVSGTLDPATRTARVRCTMQNAEHELKPEMFATVSIAVAGEKRLTVPESALLHLADKTVVFVRSGQGPEGKLRFERRLVEIAPEAPGGWVAIVKGVAPGEEVVSSGAILLAGS